jgi:hypothetical protein
MTLQRGLNAARRALLFVLGLAFVAVVPLRAAIWITNYSTASAVLMMILSLLIAGWLIHVSLQPSDTYVRRLAMECLAFGVAALMVEVAIRIWQPETLIDDSQARKAFIVRQAAQRLGRSYDSRSAWQVITDLRAQGVDALPRISREWALSPRVREHLPHQIHPLSHASSAAIVECNESGEYLIYRTDEFGFNNPMGLVASGHIDIAAVGESATLGYCVPYEQSLLGLLRRSFPRTANFGMAGTRTLSQLASFREYVEPLQPKVVLWIVNPAYADAGSEAGDPVLIRYLEPAFSQGLLARQPEVDQIIRQLLLPIEAERQRAIALQIEQAKPYRLDFMVRLPGLRSRLGYELAKAPPPADFTLFIRSLQLAARAAESWHGRLIVILLPSYADVAAHRRPGELPHAQLESIVRKLGIPVIDGAALFLQQKNPTDLFTLGINNHPNQHGYALLAKQIARQLHLHPDARVHTRRSGYDGTGIDAQNSQSVPNRIRTSADVRSRADARE